MTVRPSISLCSLKARCASIRKPGWSSLFTGLWSGSWGPWFSIIFFYTLSSKTGSTSFISFIFFLRCFIFFSEPELLTWSGYPAWNLPPFPVSPLLFSLVPSFPRPFWRPGGIVRFTINLYGAALSAALSWFWGFWWAAPGRPISWFTCWDSGAPLFWQWLHFRGCARGMRLQGPTLRPGLYCWSEPFLSPVSGWDCCRVPF